MMNVEQIIEQVKALPLSDVKKVREAVEEVLSGQTPEQKLQQKLFDAGLLSEIKPPIADFTPWENRQLAEVLDGKPISETLIEERR